MFSTSSMNTSPLGLGRGSWGCWGCSPLSATWAKPFTRKLMVKASVT